MKKFRELSEAIKDKYDEGEYDQEGDMAKSDLRSIMANAKELHDMIDDADNLPEWCQNKITLAEDYISTVANYLTAEMNEEVELDEAFPKSTQYALVHSSSKKIVAKGNKKEMTKKVKELNAKEKGSHYVGISYGSKVGDTFGEEVEQIDELSKNTLKSYAGKVIDKTRTMPQGEKKQKHLIGLERSMDKMKKEETELEEKNEPTNPELWSRAKALAKSKFDVYPSAYANGWASKWYKSKGGSWRSVNEENYEVTVMHTTKDGDKGEHTHKVMNADDSRHAKNIALQKHEKMLKSKGQEVRGMGTTNAKMVEAKENDLPFTPDAPKKKSVVVGKKPEGYSIARQLARQAMQKQIEKMQKKPMKEESRKSKIIKDVVKNKKMNDSFHSEPIVATPVDNKQT